MFLNLKQDLYIYSPLLKLHMYNKLSKTRWLIYRMYWDGLQKKIRRMSLLIKTNYETTIYYETCDRILFWLAERL